MGKGKKKAGKPAILAKKSFVIPVLIVAVAFVFAGLYICWRSNFNVALTGLIAPIIAAIIGGIFLLINTFISSSKDGSPAISQKTEGRKSPTIIADRGSSAPVTYHEASPELLDRLDSANVEKGKQVQIIEELKKKLEETEGALKERDVSEEALARFEAGDYKVAKALFREELTKGLEGLEKAATAAYYLGNIEFAELQFDEALKYYQKATELEPKNPRLLNDVGIAYHTLSKYHEAIKHHEQTLSIDRKDYGERHHTVARDLNNLGAAFQALGEYKKAREHYIKSYEIFVETLGENHPLIQQVKSNLDSLPE